MRKTTCYSNFMIVLELMVLVLLQGCYISCGDKVVFGRKDKGTYLPGASLQKGCVLEIERGKILYPPEPSTVLFEDPADRHERFSRYADFGAKLEVGKCYQWRLGLGDLSSGKTPAINSGSVQEITP